MFRLYYKEDLSDVWFKASDKRSRWPGRTSNNVQAHVNCYVAWQQKGPTEASPFLTPFWSKGSCCLKIPGQQLLITNSSFALSALNRYRSMTGSCVKLASPDGGAYVHSAISSLKPWPRQAQSFLQRWFCGIEGIFFGSWRHSFRPWLCRGDCTQPCDLSFWSGADALSTRRSRMFFRCGSGSLPIGPLSDEDTVALFPSSGWTDGGQVWSLHWTCLGDLSLVWALHLHCVQDVPRSLARWVGRIPRSWACKVLFWLNIKGKGGTSRVTKGIKRFVT